MIADLPQRCDCRGDYSSVGLDRLQSIADALGVQIHETITYSSAA
jgi:hypothetical protein